MVLRVTGSMETSTIRPAVTAIVPAKDVLRNELDRNERNIIQSIVAQFKHKESTFSINNLKTRVVCLFRQLNELTFETMQQIYVLSDKIKSMNVFIYNGCMEVQIYKNDAKMPVKIKRRPNIKEIEMCAKSFLKLQNVHQSDQRLCEEIVKLLYKFTWGGVASIVHIDLFGDTYHFKVEKLRKLSFQQLNLLHKLSDLVSNIKFDFKQKLLTFKVTRTNEYITMNDLSNNIQLKKQKV